VRIIRLGWPGGFGGSGLGERGVAHGPVVLFQFYTDLDISGSGIAGRAGSEEAEAVCGAQDAGRASVEDVGVDHGGGHVAMAEELLDGADVGAVL